MRKNFPFGVVMSGSCPRFQLTLATFTLEEAVASLKVLTPCFDVIEVGSVLCFSEGFRAPETIQAFYPKIPLVVDLRASDEGLLPLVQSLCDLGVSRITLPSNVGKTMLEKITRRVKNSSERLAIDLAAGWDEESLDRWTSLGLSHLTYPGEVDERDRQKFRYLNVFTARGFSVTVRGSFGNDELATLAGRGLWSVAVSCLSESDAKRMRSRLPLFHQVVEVKQELDHCFLTTSKGA